jgi:hypothetical protein
VSGPGVDKDAESVTTSNVAVSGNTNRALPIPSMQNWHSNKMTSAPVTGVDGVSVVSVVGVVSAVSVIVAVEVVSVPAVRVLSVAAGASVAGASVAVSFGKTVPPAVGVPSSAAQALSNSIKVNALNKNTREIFFILLLLLKFLYVLLLETDIGCTR